MSNSLAMLLELAQAVEATDPGAVTDLSAQDREIRLWRALGWALLLIVAAVVATLLAFWFRKQFLGGPKRGEREAVGFTLADLRRLRSEGKLTKHEYEQARSRLVEASQLAIARDAEGEGSLAAPRTKDVDLIRDAERP